METYNLTRHTFSYDIRDMLRELYTSPDLADVSIVTEDGKLYKAHRFILSFCSPLFRELLTISKEYSPVIYLTEVKQEEMESILKFMYLGEVSLQLGKIHEFLSVAASLKIKDLPNTIKESLVANESEEDTTTAMVIETESSNSEDRENVPVPFSDWKSLVRDRFGEAGGTCKPCGKYFASIKSHVKMKHCKVKYECQYCKHKSSSLASRRNHIMSKHEKVEILCDQCEFIASTPAGLRQHTNVKHLGVRFSCDQCGKMFSNKQHLQVHVNSVHLRLTHDCNLCDKKYLSKYDMLKHKSRKHY